jgi:hypothetical protein
MAGDRSMFRLKAFHRELRPRLYRPSLPRRPSLELLECRTLPANVFVVPLTSPVDSSHFHSLQDAVESAGSGGTVVVQVATDPSAAVIRVDQEGVTIEGDPATSTDALTPYNVNVLAADVTLDHLHLPNVTLTADHATITGCLADTIQDYGTEPSTGFHVITGNHITTHMRLSGYQRPDETNLVADNLFGGTPWPAFLELTGVSGTTVRSNQFIADTTPQSLFEAAVAVYSGGNIAAPNIVEDNTIQLGSPQSRGIMVGGYGTPLAVNIVNNSVSTSGRGKGLVIFEGLGETAFGTANVLVQGNDFSDNAIGISLELSNVDNSGLNLDLGGGDLGSTGGNDFRYFTATGTPTSGAIVTTSYWSNAPISALHNVFQSGLNPLGVIYIYSIPGPPQHMLDLGVTLDQNEAFVLRLYQDLLGRNGTLAEVGAWAAFERAAGRQATVASILRSPEALGRVVDAAYQHLLGRAADPGGRNGWIGFLQSGGTQEQMQVGIVTSREYQLLHKQDFISSFYSNLLGRTGTRDEVFAWNKAIPVLGIQGVATVFTTCVEFRTHLVGSYYTQLLHRTPTAVEASALAGLPGDMFILETFVLTSPEYLQNC